MVAYLSLPDEVVAETILWRLPVKSIIRCMCVSKSWYSLIRNRNFISTHLNRKTLTLNPQFFVGQFDMGGKTKSCLLHSENENYFGSMLLNVPRCYIDIVGSVKGLICLCNSGFNGTINFILCNPSIRHFFSIPSPLPQIREPVTGFGFDETSQDYKILSIIAGSTDCFIYSLSSNCWRVITSPVFRSLRLHFGSVVFVNGRFYWFAYEMNSVVPWIMVYDLKDETFGHISSLPECLADAYPHTLDIKEFGQSSIAIIQRNAYVCESDIWVMKENGSMESWMKLATISEIVLGFRNEDEVLMTIYKSRCVVSQKINNNKSDQLEKVEKMMDLDKRHCH